MTTLFKEIEREIGKMANKEVKKIIEWDNETQAYVVRGSIRRFVPVNNADVFEFLNRNGQDYIAQYNDNGQHIGVLYEKPVATGENASVPPGFYQARGTNRGDFLFKKEVTLDEYIPLGGVLTDVLDDIQWWLKSRDAYKKVGLRWKRGLLLYGPPGNGKTRTIAEAVHKFKDTARIIELSTVTDVDSFRGLMGDAPVIFLLEEITESITRGDLRALLNFLDGADAWDNALVIATTNYPEQLPGNVVDRPSRFDKLFHVGNPTSEAREQYLKSFLGAEGVTPRLIEATQDFSVAYLRELVVQHRLHNRSILSIIKEQDDRKLLVQKSFKARTEEVGFGFSNPPDDDDEY